MPNLLTRVPRRSPHGVATMVRTIYKRLSPEEVHAQADRVIAQLQEHFPQAASVSGGLADALPDVLAFTAFPVSHWQTLWSNNPLERLNKEIRRRRACPGRERGGYLPQPVGDPPARRRPPLADWPNSTTIEPKAAATSHSTTISTPTPHPPATSWKPLPQQHQQG